MINLIVVDDQPEFCRLIRDLLSLDPEFNVLAEAYEGAGVVRLVEELEPDVVLLDVEMPDQHGLDTLAQLRARFPAVTVVLMSAYHEKEYREEALRTGARDFFAKVVAGLPRQCRPERFADAEAAVVHQERPRTHSRPQAWFAHTLSARALAVGIPGFESTRSSFSTPSRQARKRQPGTACPRSPRRR